MTSISTRNAPLADSTNGRRGSKPGLFRGLSNPSLLSALGGPAGNGSMVIVEDGRRKSSSNQSLLSKGSSHRSLLSKGNSSRLLGHAKGDSSRCLGGKAASNRSLLGSSAKGYASRPTMGRKPASGRSLLLYAKGDSTRSLGGGRPPMRGKFASNRSFLSYAKGDSSDRPTMGKKAASSRSLASAIERPSMLGRKAASSRLVLSTGDHPNKRSGLLRVLSNSNPALLSALGGPVEHGAMVVVSDLDVVQNSPRSLLSKGLTNISLLPRGNSNRLLSSKGGETNKGASNNNRSLLAFATGN